MTSEQLDIERIVREEQDAAGAQEVLMPTIQSADLWRESGRPLLTWTVRSPETRARGQAHADAIIAEGAGLA